MVHRLVVACLLAALTFGACASRAARPRPPAPPVPRDGAFTAAAIAEAAVQLERVPYRNGGTDPSGFGCSGLVQYVFAKHGIALPRSVREQFEGGEPVDADQLRPGDLVFFSTVAPGASHVGILVKQDFFVHAPSGRGVVREDRLSASYWSGRYVGARRYW